MVNSRWRPTRLRHGPPTATSPQPSPASKGVGTEKSGRACAVSGSDLICRRGTRSAGRLRERQFFRGAKEDNASSKDTTRGGVVLAASLKLATLEGFATVRR